jgi:4-amino-4-deoxy-L-arabinose transferase-like glycosyltransferase
VLLALASFSCLLGLGRDLTSPDESRYAQIAEEVRSFEHGVEGLFLLHLNGEAYDQKPPLWFWLAALAGAPGGHVSEPAARLPSALAAIASVLLVMRLGTWLLGRGAGLVAGAILLTTTQFAILAHRASLDALLTAFTTLALAAFWRFDRRLGGRRSSLAWMHLGLGLAVLTKGPVGFLIPLLSIAAYLGWERRLRELGSLLPPWGLVLSLGPGLTWLAAATALAPEGYLASAVGENLFGRFFVGTHDAPFYFYLKQFPKQFLPWTLAWPVVWWMGRRRVFAPAGDPEAARAWRFLLSWVAATFLFFSLSSGKRGLYLLPAYPAAALLCAHALLLALEGRTALKARTLGVLGATFGLVAAASAGVALLDPPWADVPLRAFAIAIAACAGAAIAILGLHARRDLGLAPAMALLWLCLAAGNASAFLWLHPALDAQKSARVLADRAAALAGQGEPIVLFRERSLLGGLAYYSGRRLLALPSRDALREVLARGEAVVVVERKDLAAVEEVARLDVRHRIELGDEQFVVAGARPPAVAAGAAPVPREVHEAAR